MLNITRRQFLASVTAAGIGLYAGERVLGKSSGKSIRKALIVGKIDEDVLREYKAAGFDGVETRAWNISQYEAEKDRNTAALNGMKIHSVMRGWAEFNDPEKYYEQVDSVRLAISAAKGYGADGILLVPCRLSPKQYKMPQAWEYDIEFDQKTCHVKRVVAGDNGPYAEYIEAHNKATDASTRALRELAADAERCGVVICVENVWNNLWVQPDLAACFVRTVGSKWVKFYFDVANHVKYSPPQEWIRALGKMIYKVHIKDFLLNEDGRGGKFVDIRQGSVDWPIVRKELEKIKYAGWMTIEGSGKMEIAEQSRRLDLIIAGKR
jgi:hexulose-6-phosphate isomerase